MVDNHKLPYGPTIQLLDVVAFKEDLPDHHLMAG